MNPVRNTAFQFFASAFLFTASVCSAQTVGYRAPLDGILRLSGNFGEVRTNHFHSGLDLKTGGVEGRPVYAIADGHVVRINVSPTGYGKALYVEHPDGHTSVYAHLRAYSGPLAEFVRERQYAEERFAIDLAIPAGKFPVKRGEVIAYSGNSGSSGGPHLHFEIRETAGQIPVNPLMFGFNVKDDRPPALQRLWVYNHSPRGHVEGVEHEHMFPIEVIDGVYRLKDRSSVKVLGSISFGVAAIDRFTDSENQCGIHAMTVTVDSSVIHSHSINRVPFDVKRMVNTHIDHGKKHRYKDIVYRSYVAPMNRLGLYDQLRDNGRWQVHQGARHKVSIALTDLHGNVSTLQFDVEGQAWEGELTPRPIRPVELMLPGQDNSFATDDLRINIPSGCLYDTLQFTHAVLPSCKDCLTPVHAICDPSVPAEDYMNVSIRLNGNLNADRSKLLIVSLDAKDRPVAEGGTISGQWISTRTRSFGNYAVMHDTIPPVLRPKNFAEGISTAGKDTLSVAISDNLSGIASYRATLNGKWILMEHDPKNRVLHYEKDANFSQGDNILHIVAKDAVGNSTELQVNVR